MERKSKKDSTEPVSLPTAEQQLFVGTLLSLTWQMLVVVVVPFVGGHYLDERYNSTPLWTLVGLAVALTMSGIITYRGYQTLTQVQRKRSNKHD